MIAALILLLAIVVLGFAVAMFNLLRRDDADPPVLQSASGCASCNGVNDKCEQECMMETATKPIEYYDDEELDFFKGRASDAYSDEEAEQFRNVLYTMRQEDVAGWSRSLTLRGVNVPDQVKDELVMLIGG